jgi:SAM-dependent methyltransferase
MTSQTSSHDPSGWPEFYKGRDNAKYQAYCEERYKPFLALIAARMSMFHPEEASSLEIGCGIGTISAIIGSAFPRSTLVLADANLTMLERAAKRLAELGMHERVAMFELDLTASDAKPSWEPSVVHSHGLLEHFSDEQAAAIVDRHRDHYQVHYIPGLYESQSYGDERLLPLEHWRKVLRPARAYTFNEGLDYALVFHPRGLH